jgi:hypothetical protein
MRIFRPAVENGVNARDSLDDLLQVARVVVPFLSNDSIVRRNSHHIMVASCLDRLSMRRTNSTERCDMTRVSVVGKPSNVQDDLPVPVGLSGPALRALAHAGIAMAQLSRRSEAELRALHGMEPKAIQILKSALAQQGRHLRESTRPQRRSG